MGNGVINPYYPIPQPQNNYSIPLAEQPPSILSDINYRNNIMTPPLLNAKYFPRDVQLSQNSSQNSSSIDPTYRRPVSLIVQNLGCLSPPPNSEFNKRALLESVSFDARAGDLVAIMSSCSEEGSAVLKILANKLGQWGDDVGGKLLLNGSLITPKHLAARLQHASADFSLQPDVSLRQALLFVNHLRKNDNLYTPHDAKDRVDALINDLGLRNVSETRVKDLTMSEKQRLNVARHLLVDAGEFKNRIRAVRS